MVGGGGSGRIVEWVELKGEGLGREIRGRRNCFFTAMKKAADEETGTAAAGKSQIACHQSTAHWSV